MTSQGIYYLIRALVALVAIPFHECGHALAAWLLGDDTAKRQGRLSMNPFAHFDLLGTLCMVFAGVGWAKPSPRWLARRQTSSLPMWAWWCGSSCTTGHR